MPIEKIKRQEDSHMMKRMWVTLGQLQMCRISSTANSDELQAALTQCLLETRTE